jgi:hypothetical protein
MIKCLQSVLILSIYTCDSIPLDGRDGAGSVRLLVNSVMCLITSVLAYVFEHFSIVGS